MSRFEKIKRAAKIRGVIVEKVGGADPYEVYREDNHSMTGICKTLWEVESEVEAFADKPDVDNDEFQCEACKRVCDIEDSIKFKDELLCTFCGEDALKQCNKELANDC